MPAGRRASKLLSLVTSCFTSSYVRFWAHFFPETELRRTPMFDGACGVLPHRRHPQRLPCLEAG